MASAYSSGCRPALERRVPVGLDDSKRVERPGIGGRRGTRGARSRRARALRLAQRLRARGLARDERVTSQPSGSTKSTTSGPTPGTAAVRVAASSAARSIPRRAVSRPATRRTKSPSTLVALTLWFVIPPARTSHSARPPATRARPRPRALRVRARILPPARVVQRLVGHHPRHPLAEDLHRDLGARVVPRGHARTRSSAHGVAVAAARHAPDELVTDPDWLRAERDRSGSRE